MVCPEVSPEIEQMAGRDEITLIQSLYSSDYLEGKTLVVAATNDQVINQKVSSEAKKRGLLVNVVDSPALCNFIVPSIVDRSPLTIAISSSGSAPVFARMLREKLEWLVPKETGSILQTAGEERANVAQSIAEMLERRQFWENYFEQLLDWSPAKNIADSARMTIDTNLPSPKELLKSSPQKVAIISLVDLGNGDVDYLPIKTVKRLQKADEVIFNSSVPESVTDLIRRDAEMQSVKLAPEESILKRTTMETLVDKVSAGKSICLLNPGHYFETLDLEQLASTFDQTVVKLELIKALRV